MTCGIWVKPFRKWYLSRACFWVFPKVCLQTLGEFCIFSLTKRPFLGLCPLSRLLEGKPKWNSSLVLGTKYNVCLLG